MPKDPDPPSRQDDLGVIIIEEERLRESFTQIPNTILKRKDLSPGAKLTYVALLSYAWQAGSCFPGQATLSEDIGVGQRSVVRYMKELQDSGLLVVKRRGLGRTNLYTLSSWVKAKKSVPPADDSTNGEQAVDADQEGKARSANLALQEMPTLAHQQVPNWPTEEYAARTYPIETDPDNSSKDFEGDSLHINTGNLHFSKKRNFENLEIEDGATSPSALVDSRQSGEGLTAIGDIVRPRRKRTPQTAPDRAGMAPTPGDDYRASSSQTSPSGRSRTGERRSLADQATPDITAVMSQISDELHDEAERSSLGRAVRLWQQSKASEGNFIAAIYAARKIAKQRGDIEKRATGEAGGYGLRNRMPYFLRCLEDQLGLKQNAPNTS